MLRPKTCGGLGQVPPGQATFNEDQTPLPSQYVCTEAGGTVYVNGRWCCFDYADDKWSCRKIAQAAGEPVAQGFEKWLPGGSLFKVPAGQAAPPGYKPPMLTPETQTPVLAAIGIGAALLTAAVVLTRQKSSSSSRDQESPAPQIAKPRRQPPTNKGKKHVR